MKSVVDNIAANSIAMVTNVAVPLVTTSPPGIVPTEGAVAILPFAQPAVVAGPTFGEIAGSYFEHVIKARFSNNYIINIKSMLKCHLYPVLAETPIRQIKRQDVRVLLNDVVRKHNSRYPNRSGLGERGNSVYWFLHRFFNWCLDEDILDVNPCLGMRRPTRYAERERFLTDEEIRLFWLATESEKQPYRSILRLLLLTAQRRSEIADAEAMQIDREARMLRIPVKATKTWRAHLVPLSDLALEMFDAMPFMSGRSLVFSLNGKTPISRMSFRLSNLRVHTRMNALSCSEALRDGRDPEAATIEWFTLHDLRRTAATAMCRLGQQLEVVDKILNHASGRGGAGRTVNTVTRVYCRHEYLDERGVALQALADHVRNLVRV